MSSDFQNHRPKFESNGEYYLGFSKTEIKALVFAAATLLAATIYSLNIKPDKKSPNLGAVEVEFDALGGGSNVIQVYPGVTNAHEDKISNGSYPDGETVIAECITEGRLVRSDPSVGEDYATSVDWVRFRQNPQGVVSYATLTYLAIPQNFDSLANC